MLTSWNFLFGLLLLVLGNSARGDVSSYAFVQDDGSLRIDGQTYRLFGVYVPPTGQVCRTFERPVECGSRAKLALGFKIGSDFVRCEEQARNADSSIAAICSVKGDDLGAYLLRHGLAVALPGAPFEYHTLERIARAHGEGVWGIPLGG